MKSFEKPKSLLRKVSVIISDPDATDDSSSDEGPALTKPRKVKRIVHEITFLSEESEITQNRCNGLKTSRKKSPRQGKYPVGVRARPSGRYAAEIMNPVTKTKKWLGTYETTEEAAKAYVDKKAEYKTLASSRTGDSRRKDVVPSTGDSNKDLCVDLDFSSLQIPDLSLLAVGGGKDPMVSKPNGAELDFDSFLSSEYDHLLNDYSLLDNGLDISGFENSIPNELPDYDFTDMDLELGDFELCTC